MSYPTITDLPPAPSRGSAPTTFRTDMDALLAAQPNMVAEQNAQAAWMDATASQVEVDAAAASAAAAAAAAASTAATWVTGTNYVIGDVRWSPIDFKSYRRKTNGAGATDPSADGANWALLAGQGDVSMAGVQTLTNKTLTAPTIANPAIDGTITEDVYTIADGAAVDIDPANGSIQLWTLGANRTPTASNFAAGKSVTLMIADGAAYSVTWSSVGVTWVYGSAPALPTSGYGVIVLWKVGATIYGAFTGPVA